jgi:hypothetical protein
MRGLRVDIKLSNSRLVMEELNDFDLVLQNTLINLGQKKGSSSMFPNQGTELLKNTLSGFIVDVGSAARAGGLAAVGTLYFLRENEIAGEETVSNLAVMPGVAEGGTLKFNVQITSTRGRKVGATIT